MVVVAFRLHLHGDFAGRIARGELAILVHGAIQIVVDDLVGHGAIRAVRIPGEIDRLSVAHHGLLGILRHQLIGNRLDRQGTGHKVYLIIALDLGTVRDDRISTDALATDAVEHILDRVPIPQSFDFNGKCGIRVAVELLRVRHGHGHFRSRDRELRSLGNACRVLRSLRYLCTDNIVSRVGRLGHRVGLIIRALLLVFVCHLTVAGVAALGQRRIVRVLAVRPAFHRNAGRNRFLRNHLDGDGFFLAGVVVTVGYLHLNLDITRFGPRNKLAVRDLRVRCFRAVRNDLVGNVTLRVLHKIRKIDRMIVRGKRVDRHFRILALRGDHRRIFRLRDLKLCARLSAAVAACLRDRRADDISSGIFRNGFRELTVLRADLFILVGHRTVSGVAPPCERRCLSLLTVFPVFNLNMRIDRFFLRNMDGDRLRTSDVIVGIRDRYFHLNVSGPVTVRSLRRGMEHPVTIDEASVRVPGSDLERNRSDGTAHLLRQVNGVMAHHARFVRNLCRVLDLGDRKITGCAAAAVVRGLRHRCAYRVIARILRHGRRVRVVVRALLLVFVSHLTVAGIAAVRKRRRIGRIAVVPSVDIDGRSDRRLIRHGNPDIHVTGLVVLIAGRRHTDRHGARGITGNQLAACLHRAAVGIADDLVGYGTDLVAHKLRDIQLLAAAHHLRGLTVRRDGVVGFLDRKLGSLRDSRQIFVRLVNLHANDIVPRLSRLCRRVGAVISALLFVLKCLTAFALIAADRRRRGGLIVCPVVDADNWRDRLLFHIFKLRKILAVGAVIFCTTFVEHF